MNPLIFNHFKSEFNECFNKEEIEAKIEGINRSKSGGSSLSLGSRKSVDTAFSLDNHIDGFWRRLDKHFEEIYLNKYMVEVLGEGIEIPEFFRSYYRINLLEKFDVMITLMQDTFISSLQKKWVDYLTEEKRNMKGVKHTQTYKPLGLDKATLSSAFSIMAVLPLRMEVKNDLELLEKKM